MPLSLSKSCRRRSTSDIGRAGRPGGRLGVPGTGLTPPLFGVLEPVVVIPSDARGPVGGVERDAEEGSGIIGVEDSPREALVFCADDCVAGEAVRALFTTGAPFKANQIVDCLFRRAVYLQKPLVFPMTAIGKTCATLVRGLLNPLSFP